MSRIVVFGATGYTGGLVARSLAARGAAPVLAGRDRGRLEELAEELDGLDVHVADAREPASVRAGLETGDVLVSTVGPFVQHGDAALEAAVDAGAHYLDSTGEPSFIRRVFDVAGPRARGRSALVPAFGYDYVPGNLAGALALRAADGAATRLRIGYFATGSGGGDAISSGTLASVVGMMSADHHAFRDGRLALERPAARSTSLEVRGRRWRGISVGGSEHLALPELPSAARLREIDVQLGWFQSMSPAVVAGSAVLDAVTRLPGVESLVDVASRRLARRTGEGPDRESRARTGSLIVAVARDDRDQVLAEVVLEGPNAYTFTGDVLAWGARALLAEGPAQTGGVGPVQAFGLDRLEDGCAEAGLTRSVA